ncbi:MAG: cytochrome c maturation protein CcmE [Chloroflexota bacterium]
MANPTWTREEADLFPQKKSNTLKFAVAGFVMLATVAFLITNAVRGNTQLYKTVGEYYAEQDRLDGRDLRVAGWVVGDSIVYTQIDATTSRLEFDIVDDLNNPTQTLRVVAMNEPKPDLLQHDAQALVEGHAENGIFMANEGGLFLKCPTRYEELEPGANTN